MNTTHCQYTTNGFGWLLPLPILWLGACGASEESPSPPGGNGGQLSTTTTSGGFGGGGGDGAAGAGAAAGAGGGGQGGGSAADYTYACAPVGAADGDGIFSLRAFGGTLYAGEFGYGMEGQSMIFSYPPWQKVATGPTGISESVCEMWVFGGHLYANTESSGDIFRTANGQSWELVHNGPPNTIGCGLAEHQGQLYAINYDYQVQDHGRVLRSADGTSWTEVYDSGSGTSRYLREIVSFSGSLHAFAVDVNSEQHYLLTSTDGNSWQEHGVDQRFFRAHEWNGALWVSSSASYGGPTAGVWRYDGSGFELRHQVAEKMATDLVDWHGGLFVGTSSGFKNDTGTSRLLMSPDGVTFDAVCAFDELAVWAVEVLGDHLYVGAWQFQSGGHVYEVTATPR